MRCVFVKSLRLNRCKVVLIKEMYLIPYHYFSFPLAKLTIVIISIKKNKFGAGMFRDLGTGLHQLLAQMQ